ncbi:MAG: hypothetical protein ACREAA_18645 [Candidatus Polarisedimenticolia bacterium]
MTDTGPLLEECAARLRPFERARVGRAGCGVSLVVMAAMAVLVYAGLWPVGERWGAGFRTVVVSGLATAVLFFMVMAAFEHFREREVWRRLLRHMRERGVDRQTLSQAAQARASRHPGGTRLAALLKDPPPTQDGPAPS